MAEMNEFAGTGVALVTPFKNDIVDYDALERIIEYVLAGGADYLVSLGTTGEAVTLSLDECKSVKDFTVKQLKGRAPLVFGLFGGSNTARITARLGEYDLSGVDALLSSSPNYIKPTQEGIYAHYKAIAAATDLPVILYNVPSRTASNIEADTVVRLSQDCKNIIGVKEASGDMYQGACISAAARKDFLLLSGDDLTTLALIGVGGHGVISVIANAFPKTFSTMVRKARNGDFESARSLNNRLLKMYPWIFVEGNPAGIKYVLSKLNLCSPDVRMPLMSQTNASAKAMATDLEEALAFEKSLKA